MPLSDDQKKRLDEQAEHLEQQAGEHSGQQREGFQHAAKLLRDPGFRKALDALEDEGDPQALVDPRAFFKKHGADVPEGLDIRPKGRGS